MNTKLTRFEQKFVTLFSCKFQWQYLNICIEIYSAKYVQFGSTTFHQLWSSFMIPSFQNLAVFWVMNWFKWFLQASRELIFFPLRKFCNGILKMQSQVSMMTVVEYSSQAVPISTGSVNWCEVRYCFNCRCQPSNGQIPDASHHSCL